jgi:hypothetical protein
MIKHVKMLEKNGFIRKNPSSRGSSPVLIVPKPGKRDEFRMAVDCRYANSKVQPVAGFLRILEVNFQGILAVSSGSGKSRGILFLDGTWCIYTNTVDRGKH